MSRGSERSLVTSRGATKNGGTSSSTGRSGGSNTKCIITIGILLPLLAAIIGVAAWSVSSDSVHRRSPPTTVYHIGRSSYRNGDHNIFEERNDEEDLLFGQKVPIGGAVSKDILGPDVEEERDILPPATDPPAEGDPLYVVHYVPRGPSQEATSEPPLPSPPPDVLSKLLKSGKGAGKGTPQFVVFAPMANEQEDDVHDRSMEINRKRTRKRKKPRKELDYEDDEYADNTQVRHQVHSSLNARKSAVPAPRNGYYDSANDGQWIQNYNNNNNQQQNQQHCCNVPQSGGGGMMPTQQAPAMMTTEAPKQGITITLGQGLPLGPLGLLRQILRPKVDLKKKLFFGVQLENGFGFGGGQNAGGGGNAQMGGGGQMNQGGTGGGNMGHMGQMGGGMGQQGGGGGITYTFG